MSLHDDNIRIQHMLDSANEALSLIKGKKRGELDSDRLLGLALVRLMEVLGEAAGRITKDHRLNHPEIPWIQIIGLRNRLIHGYDSVDMDILWNIVSKDLPPLILALEKNIVKKENDEADSRAPSKRPGPPRSSSSR
jgi:uncharacterized protein with HEPN domain